MIRALVITLSLATAALLEMSVFPHLSLAGFRPDLLLLVTAAFALYDGPLTGTVVGFGAGLLHDLLLVQPPVGLSAAVLVGAGYVVGVVRPYLASGSATAPAVVAFGSGLLGTAAYGVLARLLGDERFEPELLIQASLLVAVYNTLLSPLVMYAVRNLTERFPPERAAQL